MTGFIRNLFGNYQLYDSPDYTDLDQKMIWAGKWSVYLAGSLSLFEVLYAKDPPKGFGPIALRIGKFVIPTVVASGTFVGTLFAVSQLRGKKDDEWNSLWATLVSGSLFAHLRKTPFIYLRYCLLVGLITNASKQNALYNWNWNDWESAGKRYAPGSVYGGRFFDFVVIKDRPQRWINGDEQENTAKE